MIIEDIRKWVEEGIVNGTLLPFEAIKVAPIRARQGTIGEVVISWSVDKDGNPVKEKEAEVTIDETGKPGWIATKIGKDGEPIVDANGNLNQWIISAKTFAENYEPDPENPELFRKKPTPQTFVQISESITFSDPYNGTYTLAAGGYLNITNLNKIYAVSGRDFNDTYQKLEEETRTR